MRKKVFASRGHAQSCPASGLGEFPAAETGDRAVPSGLYPAPADAERQMPGGDGGNAAPPDHARSVAKRPSCAVRIVSRLIRGYQILIAPHLGDCCRFTPSCSHYAQEALERHGFWKGSVLTVWRLLRCQPFCRGGYDPVPARGRWRAPTGANAGMIKKKE